MRPFYFALGDWWSQWSIDRAGVESGNYRVKEIREMLDRGEVGSHTWLRHRWMRRYALVGEVLYASELATFEEYEKWFPTPRIAESARLI